MNPVALNEHGAGSLTTRACPDEALNLFVLDNWRVPERRLHYKPPVKARYELCHVDPRKKQSFPNLEDMNVRRHLTFCDWSSPRVRPRESVWVTEVSTDAPASNSPTVNTTEPKRARIAELDSLRGLAAVSVLVFHLTASYAESLPEQRRGFINFNVGGMLGVQLFFIISGFVIFMTVERTRRPIDFVWSRFSRSLSRLLGVCNLRLVHARLLSLCRRETLVASPAREVSREPDDVSIVGGSWPRHQRLLDA